jgi:hypothetical protein
MSDFNVRAGGKVHKLAHVIPYNATGPILPQRFNGFIEADQWRFLNADRHLRFVSGTVITRLS